MESNEELHGDDIIKSILDNILKAMSDCEKKLLREEVQSVNDFIDIKGDEKINQLLYIEFNHKRTHLEKNGGYLEYQLSILN